MSMKQFSAHFFVEFSVCLSVLRIPESFILSPDLCLTNRTVFYSDELVVITCHIVAENSSAASTSYGSCVSISHYLPLLLIVKFRKVLRTNRIVLSVFCPSRSAISVYTSGSRCSVHFFISYSPFLFQLE